MPYRTLRERYEALRVTLGSWPALLLRSVISGGETLATAVVEASTMKPQTNASAVDGNRTHRSLPLSFEKAYPIKTRGVRPRRSLTVHGRPRA